MGFKWGLNVILNGVLNVVSMGFEWDLNGI